MANAFVTMWQIIGCLNQLNLDVHLSVRVLIARRTLKAVCNFEVYGLAMESMYFYRQGKIALH